MAEAGLYNYYEDANATFFTLILYTFSYCYAFRSVSTLNYATCRSMLQHEWKFSTLALFYDVAIPEILFKLSIGVDGDSYWMDSWILGELLWVFAFIFCSGDSLKDSSYWFDFYK